MTDGIGGIVLCGGQSRRMGVPKATLPFGGEVMLTRVVRLLGGVVSPIVVVAAREQALPPLPPQVIVTRDKLPQQGPLEGLRAGLAAIRTVARAAFVTSCDVPLLQPPFVARLIEMLGDHDICVPVEDKFAHPLAAVYRTAVLDTVQSLLDAGQLRPAFLFQRVKTRRVPVDELREVDPQLASLVNLNEPANYRQALAAAGIAPPEVDPFA